MTEPFLSIPDEPPVGEYTPEDRGGMGRQLVAVFPNGYGASVIIGPYSYGGPEGKYEIAVMHPDSLCYATPITDDVIGWLSPTGVIAKLREIATLPRNDECDHGHTGGGDLWESDEESGRAGFSDVLTSLIGGLRERSSE